MILWDGSPVPIEQFGCDHWHLFRVVMDVCVASSYYLSSMAPRMSWLDGATICRTVEIAGHTDLDVLSDLAAAGLLSSVSVSEETVYLPSLHGRSVSVWIDHHLTGGGHYSNFDPSVETPFPEIIPPSMYRNEGGSGHIPSIRVRYLRAS